MVRKYCYCYVIPLRNLIEPPYCSANCNANNKATQSTKPCKSLCLKWSVLTKVGKSGNEFAVIHHF